MNALTLLKKDHDEVKELLEKIDATTERSSQREKLFAKLREELRLHEAIEEEIFYPALEQHRKARDIVLEGYEEHQVVDYIAEDLAAVPFDDPAWHAKFSVMKENILHHIKEEEGEMFEAARAVLESEELDELGAELEERKLQEQPSQR